MKDIKRMKRIVTNILLIPLIISLCACTARKDGTGEDTAVSLESGSAASENDQFYRVIPPDAAEMFRALTCTGELPDKKNINSIVLARYNPAGNTADKGTVIYAELDLAAGKAYYGYADGRAIDKSLLQTYELGPDDIARFRNAVNKDCLKYGIQEGTYWWRIALSYSDGSRYAYELHEDAYLIDTPDNIMVRALFDKMDPADTDLSIYGLIIPEDG